MRRWAGLCTSLLLPGLLGSCLSSADPLPPVRWFDPLPPGVGAVAGGQPRVAASPHLGREFVVRVAAREVAFDAQHQWIAEPRDLVAAVVAASPAGQTAVDVDLLAFELDVTASPRAHVHVLLRPRQGEAGARAYDLWAAAADRSPPAFAAAMAEALADLGRQLAAR